MIKPDQINAWIEEIDKLIDHIKAFHSVDTGFLPFEDAVESLSEARKALTDRRDGITGAIISYLRGPF